jgi:orotidine-5'-phosphate decarboxylase
MTGAKPAAKPGAKPDVRTPARERLVLSLDVGGLDTARALAARLVPWFATAKVGFELFAEAGPEAFDALHALGMRVFADLKLHDIPTTVERAATVLGRAGVETLNFHAAGGVEMLRAGVRGLRAGAEVAGHPAPIALGVTVLTSDPHVEAFGERLQWAKDAGCEGVVCSAHEIALAHAARMRTMVAGIRLPDAEVHDQARVATPNDAARAGADWMVIGRAVTAAPDAESAAAAINAMVDNAMVDDAMVDDATDGASRAR